MPDRFTKGSAKLPPGYESDLAQRRTTPRRQAVENVGHRQGRLDGFFARNKKNGCARQANCPQTVIAAVAEKRDRA